MGLPTPQSNCISNSLYSSYSKANGVEDGKPRLELQNQIYRNVFEQVGIIYPEMDQLNNFKIPLKYPFVKANRELNGFLWKMTPEREEKESTNNDNYCLSNGHLDVENKEYVRKSILAPHEIKIEKPTIRVARCKPDPYQWSCYNYFEPVEIKQEKSIMTAGPPSELSLASYQNTFFSEVGTPSSASPGALIIVTPNYKHEVSSEDDRSHVSSFSSCLTAQKSPSLPKQKHKRRFCKFQSEKFEDITDSDSSSEEKNGYSYDYYQSPSPECKKMNSFFGDFMCTTVDSEHYAGNGIKMNIQNGFGKEKGDSEDDVLIIGLNESELYEF